MKRRVVLGWFCGLLLPGAGVAAPQWPVVRASEVRTCRRLDDRAGWWLDHGRTPAFMVLDPARYHWHQPAYLTAPLPLDSTAYPTYLTFAVHNDLPDTARLYLYTATQQRLDVRLTDDRGRPLRSVAAQEYARPPVLSHNVYPLTIAPGQMVWVAGRAEPMRQRGMTLEPWLVESSRTGEFFNELVSVGYYDGVFSVLFCGMLLMMLLYILLKYVQIRSSEYLYYAAYMAFFLAYFVLKGLSFYYDPLGRAPFYYAYLNQMLQVAAYCTYFPFFRKFLNVKQTLPAFDRLLKGATVVLVAYALLHLVLLAFPATYAFRLLLWDLVRLSLLGITFAGLVVVNRVRSPLTNYLVAGGTALGVLGLLAMLFTADPQLIATWVPPFHSPLTYFQLGILIELLCFSLGLGYKNRRDEIEKLEAKQALRLEAERQAFEQFRAVVDAREAERKRISREMHDDIGTGLTSILYLSHRLQTNQEDPAQLVVAGKIAHTATQLVDSMNGIIWSMNREHDSLPHLVAYLRHHVAETAQDANLACAFDIQDALPNTLLPGELRRNVYLTVKESVHNVLKHAHAQHLTMRVRHNGTLTIELQDDGVGFGADHARPYGNGLKNMRQRMGEVGGAFYICAPPGQGTTVSLHIPLAASQPVAP